MYIGNLQSKQLVWVKNANILDLSDNTYYSLYRMDLA